MQSLDALERALRESSPPPSDHGIVQTISLRLGDGAHQRASEVELTVDGGVVGDRWASGDAPKRHSQVTFMNATVARLIEHADRASYESGDNFQVDLDLSEANLPPGSLVRLGSAELLVTAEPHRGCKKFGADALRWVNLENNRPLRLRGIHLEVVTAGKVRVGETVNVVRRGPSES